mmetsp:Transcript_31644/g.94671  ORF Transcript_31644/g.94671 Transcript_31644/m.94671 type:complete len:104 (-) Transcript_31644:507-818(-)|eukprot:CAMPEP_0113546924 /NCGR_PEP_ID=MMETSP0015_2-20120614/12072_1 /TAXON_ID=2838 /ORGANISM="Odontella" /LENGTH=103 /DNA_ID=CAMNT_0000447425 /DNA_START=164 /DNA_END=475 /DNA_ORIENTATION=+ /assembly_acc=CAM_ASM_000160
MSDDEAEDVYVKLISAEGNEIFLEKRVAIAGSETMKAMLEGQFKESEQNLIRFPDIAGHILEKVVRYMHYKVKYSNATGRIPEFPIEPEIALELLVASNYLNC